MKSFKLKGLKYNKGKYNLYDDRFVFFPPKLINILSSIYGEGVKSLLVWLGKKAGWTLIQKWEEQLKIKDLEDLVEQFTDILSNQGWGRFIIKKVSEKLIIVNLKHNISSNLESNSKFICYFITGILTGFGEFALYKVKTYENKCCLEDPEVDYCQFIIEKME
jgi:predicted hydrocarbon binding protein